MALVRHPEDKLPRGAQAVFRAAEAGEGVLYLPVISLGELFYLALRGRLDLEHPRAVVEEVINQVRAAGCIRLSSLGPRGWSVFLDLEIRQLHDRLLAAEAVARRIPLLTNDRELAGVSGLRVVWA